MQSRLCSRPRCTSRCATAGILSLISDLTYRPSLLRQSSREFLGGDKPLRADCGYRLMTAAAAIGGTRLTLTLRREVLSNPGSRSRNTLSSSNEERVETGGRECSRDYGDMSLGYSEFTGGRRSLGTRGGCPPTPTRRSTGASSSSMQTQKAPKPNVGAMSSMEFWDTLRESWQVGSAQGRGTATV